MIVYCIRNCTVTLSYVSSLLFSLFISLQNSSLRDLKIFGSASRPDQNEGCYCEIWLKHPWMQILVLSKWSYFDFTAFLFLLEKKERKRKNKFFLPFSTYKRPFITYVCVCVCVREKEKKRKEKMCNLQNQEKVGPGQIILPSFLVCHCFCLFFLFFFFFTLICLSTILSFSIFSIWLMYTSWCWKCVSVYICVSVYVKMSSFKVPL